MPSRQIILAYVPVLHRGYWQFFEAFPNANEIYVFDKGILADFDYIRKDLRALNQAQQVKMLAGLGRFKRVGVVNKKDLKILDKSEIKIILPDEDISRGVVKAIKNADIELHPIFLRWDRSRVEGVDKKSKKEPTTDDQRIQKLIQKAIKAAGQSSDIWRHVGAILIDKRGKKIGVASNKAEPSEHTPWIEGDPRNLYKRGVGLEQSLFIHAEAALIAKAAKRGISLEKATIYVTTFPCPSCAKLIAHSGIALCYYKDGYATLDGERVLKEYDVRAIRVIMPAEQNDSSKPMVPYV
jgi:dCMP deaminase